jgi:hypothetical protein
VTAADYVAYMSLSSPYLCVMNTTGYARAQATGLVSRQLMSLGRNRASVCFHLALCRQYGVSMASVLASTCCHLTSVGRSVDLRLLSVSRQWRISAVTAEQYQCALRRLKRSRGVSMMKMLLLRMMMTVLSTVLSGGDYHDDNSVFACADS